MAQEELQEMKAFVTFEVGADQKLTSAQVIEAIKKVLELDESMREFTGRQYPLGDFTVNYVRVPITGIVWEEE